MRRVGLATAAGFLGLVALVAGCGGRSWEAHRITLLSHHDGRILVGVHCDDRGRAVVVSESPTEVRVRLETSGPTQLDCAKSEVVHLDEPLGDRVVVDDLTGAVVERSRPW